jgi:oxygen-independent coproporphyrinogen-3 oxidase
VKDDLLTAIGLEIDFHRDFFRNHDFETIYFGGGTPSLLTADDLLRLFSFFNEVVDLNKVVEISIEINPDDFTSDYAIRLKQTPINRLSFGLQSFDEGLLNKMGRRHTVEDSFNAIQLAVDSGFDNITVDLIYGIPGLTDETWRDTIAKVVKMPVQHVSAYHLTIEKGTAFYRDLKSGRLTEMEDEQSLRQFKMMVDGLAEAGFEHYEISNFARKGFRSKHNSLYWKGIPYLGLGPSAHSFDGTKRWWNVASVNKYIHGLKTGEIVCDYEELTEIDHFNERLMLGLRTLEGVDESLLAKFSADLLMWFYDKAGSLLKSGQLVKEGNFYKIPQQFKFVTDSIIESLFYLKE